MWKLLGLKEKKINQKYKGVHQSATPEQFVAYLDELGRTVAKSENVDGMSLKIIYAISWVDFLSAHSRRATNTLHQRTQYPPADHATGTNCRPDFTAVVEQPQSRLSFETLSDPPKSYTRVKKKRLEPGEIPWSLLETTGEIRSKGTSEVDSLHQSISYTAYLLQMRPDLIAVVGIHVDNQSKTFKIIFCNANCAHHTESIKWGSSTARPLLYAYITHLYRPYTDPTIERIIRTLRTQKDPGIENDIQDKNKKIVDVTFTITTPSQKYDNCRIYPVGNAFERRTTVFRTAKGDIIKEQYIDIDRRFREGPILGHVHHSGTFPGVVRISSHEEVDLSKGIPKGKIKTRLVMLDQGVPFVEAKTPLEALTVAYDLLEGNAPRRKHSFC